MKLLFVHETKLKEDDAGNYYTGGSYDQSVWDRYLSISNDLTVISRKEKKIYNHELAQKNFNIFDKEIIKFIEIPDLTSSLGAYLSISNRIKRHDIVRKAVFSSDYVIARISSGAGFLAMKYCKKYNKPYLVEVVGCPWDALWNYNYKGKLLAPLAYMRMRRNVRNAPLAIYVTNEFLQRRYPTKGESVGCSDVALQQFDDSIIEKRIGKIGNMDKGSKLILGTLAAVDVKYKGQQYIIQALGKLKKEGITNFEYHLAGGGNPQYLKTIAKKYNVEDQIIFLGRITHDKVFDWLDSIDLYVQPSRQEGLPRALVEAMSRGLPAFGAKTGGIPELLEKQYIFSNTRRNISEICAILQRFTKDTLMQASERNYNESKKYEKDLIGERRQKFMRKLYESSN